MERGSVALLFLFLFFLCFPFSSDSQKVNPSTSLLIQEQAHEEVTIKDIKGEEDDKSIDIFRAGKGSHGVAGGRGGGRKASPKKGNATLDHRPALFFSAASVLFTGFIMFSLPSFDMSIRFCCA
ncbi:hypothetical protein CARUB_v10010659mg [Capsella rubella]|uniref:Transmembrane protein n=1 Tax=Capsella rubella TaxID=81985 RepID=R0GML1_9BRAS|nr:uncharacterized protein LOC17898703 [Capsella rubella]EOA37202.1 hypothetical protein CARUB_v10010659mg [Capsella rubella]